MKCLHLHSVYPHEPGRMIGCPGCDWQCHCGPGVLEGREPICVFMGHEENESINLDKMSLEELEKLAEDAAAASYDGGVLLERLRYIIELRTLDGIEKASDDG